MKSRAAAAVVPQHREYTLARKLFRAKGNDLSIKQLARELLSDPLAEPSSIFFDLNRNEKNSSLTN